MAAPAPAPAPTHEDTYDAIDEAFTKRGTLQSMKGDLKNIGGGFLYDDIEKNAEKIAEKYKKDIANRIGQLLHNLHEHKPEKKTLKNRLIHLPCP